MKKKFQRVIDNMQSYIAVAEAKGWTRSLPAWIIAIMLTGLVVATTDPAESKFQQIIFSICLAFTGIGVAYVSYRILFRERLHNIMETFDTEYADVAKALIYSSIFILIGLVIMGSGL